MSQPPRVDFEGAIHHVAARGNGRGRIFLDDVDYLAFLRTFSGVSSRYGWVCHAFCLMPNHYHLLLEMTEANLSAGIRVLNNVYARRFNRRHERQDHVFRARFRSALVERESHALEASRYIVLNAVRAGLCKGPEDWPWSSYSATAGLEPPLPFLTTARVVEQFGRDRKRACERYREFVADGLRPAGLLAACAADAVVLAA